MTQPQGPRPSLNVHGAIDLSGLGRPPAVAQAQVTGPEVVDVTEATFPDIIKQSDEVPVLIALWSAGDPVSSAVTALLATLVGQMEGRVLLARVDAARAPQVAQAIGTQTGSAVAAVVRGQAVPLPPLEKATSEQVRSVIEQVVAMAVANGVTGRVAGATQATAAPDVPEPPSLHDRAYDAIERDDLDAAAVAFQAVLAESPRDELARAGLAQVELLRRTRFVDPVTARTSAANLDDIDAQLLVADLDMLGGHVDDAFARLVDVIRRSNGPERERTRLRLLELFGVVGDTDARVVAARRALTNALY